MVQHQSKRYLYLLNDVILVTSNSSASKSFGIMSADKICIHNILFLDAISINSLIGTGQEDTNCAFEIVTSDRSYEFVAETESDKRVWLEEIETAIYAFILTSQENQKIGWMHGLIVNTIFAAAFSGNIDRLRSLLSVDSSSINNRDELGMTAIHWAAFNGHAHVVEYLIENGAIIDQLNNGLNTALMLAAAQGHETVVLMLLAHDADATIRNLKDRDALYMAVLYAQQSKGLNVIIRALVAEGIDVNMPDSSGSPPLHECASRNLSRSVMLLVDCGANVNLAHFRNGLTPLQLACTTLIPDVETVRALLDKGAYPNWKDAAMRSSFDMVLSSHAIRFKNKNIQSLSTGDNASMKRTVDEVGLFAQDALPVLMEIVRKGGRYTEDTITTLRTSFQVCYSHIRHFILVALD